MSAADRTRSSEEPAAAEAPARDEHDPAAVRWQIELTRQALGDTVQALVDKADVRAHMRERVDRQRESLHGTAVAVNRREARVAAIGIAVAVAVLLVMRMRRR